MERYEILLAIIAICAIYYVVVSSYCYISHTKVSKKHLDISQKFFDHRYKDGLTIEMSQDYFDKGYRTAMCDIFTTTRWNDYVSEKNDFIREIIKIKGKMEKEKLEEKK